MDCNLQSRGGLELITLAQLLTLLSCGCLLTGSTCPMSRGYRYYSDINLCVRYGSSAQWFQSASRTCTMDGGHLVYINSQAEYERLKDFINEWTAHLRDDNGV